MEIKYQFDLLKNWITENGGFVSDKLSIDYSPNQGRFLKSNQEVEIGESLFKIPESLLLNPKNCNYKLKYDVSDVKDVNEKICNIVAFLIEYKNENSFWEPYIYSLPPVKNFYEHPIYLYHHGRLPNISERFTELIHQKYIDFITLKNYIYSENIFEVLFEEEILWAFLIVSTRAWDKAGLVPIGDLFQHSYQSNMKLKYENGICEMISDRKFESESLIFDNYSVYDNVSLLVNYGFLNDTECNFKSISIDYNSCNQNNKIFIRDFIANKKNEVNSSRVFQYKYEISKSTNVIILNIENFPENIEIMESPNEYDLDSEIFEMNFIIEMLRSCQIYENLDHINLKALNKNSIDYKIYKLIKGEQELIDYYIKYLSNKVQELNKSASLQ